MSAYTLMLAYKNNHFPKEYPWQLVEDYEMGGALTVFSIMAFKFVKASIKCATYHCNRFIKAT